MQKIASNMQAWRESSEAMGSMSSDYRNSVSPHRQHSVLNILEQAIQEIQKEKAR